jgi:endonuclease I
MKKLFFILLLVPATLAFAAAPTTYYDSAEGQSSDNLRYALQSIIDGHTNVGYAGLYNVYKTSDNTASGKVWDMYSTCNFSHGNTCGSYSAVCDCYNREHSVPQSWFGKANPMVADAFHVYPTDGKVNNQRGNLQFGECANGTVLPGGKALGKAGQSTFPGYTSLTVFEPHDDYKGDFARTYFYMATRYADICGGWGNAFNAVASNSGLSKYSIALFLKWHRADPVSQKEITRNDAVYAKQHNRNPFIDYPMLAEFIWGTQKGQPWYKTSTPIDQVEMQWLSVSPNPAVDYLLVNADGVDQMSYQLVDLSGKMLQSGRVNAGDQISVTDLSNGIYLLKVEAGAKTTVQKVVVNR